MDGLVYGGSQLIPTQLCNKILKGTINYQLPMYVARVIPQWTKKSYCSIYCFVFINVFFIARLLLKEVCNKVSVVLHTQQMVLYSKEVWTYR